MLGSNAALAMCVGFLSFDRKDTDPVVALSAGANGEFSMTRFAAEGMRKTHPLLTFRCLPNMPAFHVSVNFDIRGPYLATYPGIAQTYGCIEQAVRWLRDGKVAVALVGAVAHQHNFLVEHHLSRVAYPADLTAICDAGAVFVLEREADAHKRGATVSAVLERCERSYLARDMLEDPGPALSDTATDEPLALGCASMMVALSEHIAQRRTSPAETLDPTHAVHANNLQNKRWTHSAQSLDGHFVSSSWELLC
jgi:3-oxoacyl-(acyl-carrier-protein) synthase